MAKVEERQHLSFSGGGGTNYASHLAVRKLLYSLVSPGVSVYSSV